MTVTMTEIMSCVNCGNLDINEITVEYELNGIPDECRVPTFLFELSKKKPQKVVVMSVRCEKCATKTVIKPLRVKDDQYN